MSSNEPVPRVGGRVLLLDPQDRVLLIHERIEHGRTHWLTPGGGVEVGEEPSQAAVREVYEETGLRVRLPAGIQPVLLERRRWSWAGVTYDQVDHYFVARVGSGLAIRPSALTQMETQTLLGYRWWTSAALQGSSETFVPGRIAELLERAAADASSGA